MQSTSKARSAAPATAGSPLVADAARLPSRRRQARSPLLQALTRTVRNPMGLFGLTILTLLVLAAVAAPMLSPHDPGAVSRHGVEAAEWGVLARDGSAWPGSAEPHHLWEPSVADRRRAVRVARGGRRRLYGLCAGYIGGWADIVIMRIYDALLAFPGLLLGIAVIAITGPGIFNVALAIAIAQMPGDARLPGRSCSHCGSATMCRPPAASAHHACGSC